MFKRLSFAVLGASAVTVILILGMSRIAEFFERPDSQLYMRVMDFIPGSGARQLPDKRMPEAQPERARVETPAIAPDAADDIGSRLEFDQGPQEIDIRIDLDEAGDGPPPVR